MSTSPPQDVLSPAWVSVAKRLQKAARTDGGRGLAIVSINILVDQKGVPRVWTEPVCRKIEPADYSNKILEALSNGTLPEF